MKLWIKYFKLVEMHKIFAKSVNNKLMILMHDFGIWSKKMYVICVHEKFETFLKRQWKFNFGSDLKIKLAYSCFKEL